MSASKISLYNTLTRRKEAFEPLDSDNVRMYVCGPTVYDFAHIGNARPAIVFDVLFRLLNHVYGKEHVTYVRNITDLDDKINARAVRDFPDLPLNQAIRQVTEKTTVQYQSDMAELGCLPPTFEPRATEFVLPRTDGKPDMVTMIGKLIAGGHAYVAKGEQGREVLFRVKSMAAYGALSKRSLDDQQAGARIAVEAHKEDPADFVLWKESSDKEPGWEAEFDGEVIYGRPGWHIECSAMSAAYLGEIFDIHGGGLDLIFPHHENEIAQSCCAHHTDLMAQVWMHNGFLQVEGQKMSKSLGNFHTVNEVLATDKVGGRKWPGDVVRLAMLMTNYREPIDFSIKRLEEADSILAKWRRRCEGVDATRVPDEIVARLCDDLDMAGVMAELNRSDIDAGELRAALSLIGFDMSAREAAIDPTELVEKRLQLIAEKNWPEADRIRDDLLAQGIQLKDGKDPDTGERVTTWEVVG